MLLSINADVNSAAVAVEVTVLREKDVEQEVLTLGWRLPFTLNKGTWQDFLHHRYFGANRFEFGLLGLFVEFLRG